ncbi:LOW QUALITY PROTEIN: dehydrogenase/reductase SDR family member 12 [Dugong dugon]
MEDLSPGTQHCSLETASEAPKQSSASQAKERQGVLSACLYRAWRCIKGLYTGTTAMEMAQDAAVSPSVLREVAGRWRRLCWRRRCRSSGPRDSARPTTSLYRTTLWFAKGLREYTKSGYESVSQDFILDDLEVQLPGRAFLITGGNSGIGRATATEIAKRGGTVHLVCRDQDQAEEAKGGDHQGERYPAGWPRYVLLMAVAEACNDISNPWLASHLLTSRQKASFLPVQNCLMPPQVGFFTTALIPVLEKEHDPRVVTVSSEGMLVQKLNTDDLQSERMAFNGTVVYAENKVNEVISQDSVQLSMPGSARMKDRLRLVAQGAHMALWLAPSSAATVYPSSQFFQEPLPHWLKEKRSPGTAGSEASLGQAGAHRSEWPSERGRGCPLSRPEQ